MSSFLIATELALSFGLLAFVLECAAIGLVFLTPAAQARFLNAQVAELPFVAEVGFELGERPGCVVVPVVGGVVLGGSRGFTSWTQLVTWWR